jgi:manganese/zinc/iron transport system permease protein
MNAELEIVLIAVVTAVAAALPGVFLVLRRMSMVSDAISHAILPGIVIAFFATDSLTSPVLVLAAAASGVLAVALIEALHRTGLVTEDAAIGLVFPALFSIGVILISRWASGVHLDTDAVLLGELAYAPFDRLLVAGVDCGPKALWTMGAILCLNLAGVTLAFKELKLATIDPDLAALLGFSPALIHYALMTAVSVTAVGAFQAVGAILVIALMVAPAATALLLTDRLAPMLWAAAAVAATSAAAGYWLARTFDVSIAGAMATTAGALFAVALAAAPHRGLLAQALRRRRQRVAFSVHMLLVHLLQHEHAGDADRENRISDLHRHLQWTARATELAMHEALDRRLVSSRDALLQLTESGRALAESTVSGGTRSFT